MLSFQLSDKFIESYVTKLVAWGPIGEYTYERTYARSLGSIYARHQVLYSEIGTDLSRNKEQWWLTVARVVEGTYSVQKDHCKRLRLPWDETKAQRSAQVMYDLIFNFKFTPPGRGLFAMGTPTIEKIGGAALNNCAFVSTKDVGSGKPGDFSRPFAFLMDMSMLGVGVGFDTEGAGTARIYEPIRDGGYEFVVADTREGWVSALCYLLDAFGERSVAPPLPQSWNVDAIRPAGAPIGFGGVASGPGPLLTMLAEVEDLLWKYVGRNLDSVGISDICNLIGKCVVSGNVRRSAELALGDADDIDFVQSKDYEKFPKEVASHRWAANISVNVPVGYDYTELAKQTARNGEPGYFWIDNARSYSRMDNQPDDADRLAEGTNPCGEQTLEDHELCCLVEVYPSNHDNYLEFERTLKYAYLYAKTVTLIPTHNERTNAVLLRNRRIGVSLTGITQAITKFGTGRFRPMLDEGYSYITALDNQYSRWLCIPKSIKRTSVKPSGTVSLLAGVTPGIHWPHSEYYWRVVRFAENSAQCKELIDAGYRAHKTGEPNTIAIYFPVKEKLFSRDKYAVSMWEQVAITAMMQKHWSDNQVSATITFKPEEAKDIPHVLSLYDNQLKSITFLPLQITGIYDHAPYQMMTKDEYEQELVRLSLYGKPLLATNTDAQNDKFCDGDVCIL
jgi:ribonucleoside-triphosphate reductase